MGAQTLEPGKLVRYVSLGATKQEISATVALKLLATEANTISLETTFIHFYNLPAALVTVGTTVPFASFAVPNGDGIVKHGIRTPDEFYPIHFRAAGLTVACTSEQSGVGGATAPTAAVYAHFLVGGAR